MIGERPANVEDTVRIRGFASAVNLAVSPDVVRLCRDVFGVSNENGWPTCTGVPALEEYRTVKRVRITLPRVALFLRIRVQIRYV